MAPGTGSMEYVRFFVGHTVVAPSIGPGAGGGAVVTVTGNVCAALVPHVLLAVTEILPLEADPPVLTVIVVVPCPETIVQPAGTVHA